MKTFSTLILRASSSFAFVGLLGLASPGCDLPDKNLGDDEPSASEGPACTDGETMMDDCNTCTCEDGAWACTEIGCDPDSGGMSCDPGDEPDVECGECSCVDGEWLCTAIGCPEPECVDGEEMMDDCNTCTCAGGQWACTDQACPPSPLATCTGAEPDDPIFITDASILGDILTVSTDVSGGCGTHEYGSCWTEAFDESEPVQAGVTISHEGDDPCEAIVSEVLDFDLTPMREAWVAGYGQASGTIIVHVGDYGAVEYGF